MSRLARLIAALLLAAPLAAATPASAQRAIADAAAAQSAGFDPARLRRLDEAMAKAVADGHVAGMTTLLVRHGQVVELRTYGKQDLASGAPMRPDAIFRIYSMTKPLTGVAMMILFEEGKWRLDDPITKFMPEFKDLRVMTGVDDKGNILTVPANRPPTMREVMSHMAGFGYGLSDRTPVDSLFRERQVLESSDLKTLAERVSGIPLLFQPGTGWSYSIAVDLQGALVERISGQRFGDFMAEHIFRPLKMDDTAFYTPKAKALRQATLYATDPATGKMVVADNQFGFPLQDVSQPPPADLGGSGLMSTAADYGRFAQMMLNGGELDGARVLSPASIELMGTNVIPEPVLASGHSGFSKAVGFGLDFRVVNDPRAAGSLGGKGELSWSGAAGTWFWIDPQNDLYFVGMVQRLGGTGGADFESLSRTLVYQALTHPER